MADSHAPAEDPDSAPMHYDLHETFTSNEVTVAVLLAFIAIVGGIVAGLTIV